MMLLSLVVTALSLSAPDPGGDWLTTASPPLFDLTSIVIEPRHGGLTVTLAFDPGSVQPEDIYDLACAIDLDLDRDSQTGIRSTIEQYTGEPVDIGVDYLLFVTAFSTSVYRYEDEIEYLVADLPHDAVLPVVTVTVPGSVFEQPLLRPCLDFTAMMGNMSGPTDQFPNDFAAATACSADFDNNLRVDEADFTYLSGCRTRSHVPAPGPCGDADLDDDGDVDQDDFGELQRQFSP